MKHTCISINGFAGDRTPHGMKECHALSRTIGARFGIDVEYHGEPSPASDLTWDQALDKSRETFARSASLIKDAFERGVVPLIVTPRCATALATLPQVVVAYPDCVIAYFDAHGDLTTPETSESGYLGGMPLAATLGLWESGYGNGLRPEQLVHIGGRDFDDCEIDLLHETDIHVFSKERLEEDRRSLHDLIADKAVFVHIDVDVFDPTEVTAEYAVADGLLRQHVKSVLKEITAHATLVGLEITEFSPKNDVERENSYSALLEALEGLAWK